MAFKLITTIHRYIGSSTDNKPATGVTVGSTFQEVDTGKVYIYSAGERWEVNKGTGLSVGEFQEGIGELRVLLEKVYLELQAANLANGIEVK